MQTVLKHLPVEHWAGVNLNLKSVIIIFLYFINPRISTRDSALLKVTSGGQMFVFNASSVFIVSLTLREL